MKKKYVISYSCGKDSTLALHRMINEGNDIKALLVTVNKNENRSWFHGVPLTLVEKVSNSLEIPIIMVESSGDDYEEVFTKTLIKAKEEFNICGCIYGDIDIDLHRKWGTDRCKEAGIEAIFPLWQEDRENLVCEFIDTGYKAIIKKVDLSKLDKEFLGKIINRDTINEIKLKGSDPCGENGEYHTFVFDGPLFKEKVEFKINEMKNSTTHGFLEIEER